MIMPLFVLLNLAVHRNMQLFIYFIY